MENSNQQLMEHFIRVRNLQKSTAQKDWFRALACCVCNKHKKWRTRPGSCRVQRRLIQIEYERQGDSFRGYFLNLLTELFEIFSRNKVTIYSPLYAINFFKYWKWARMEFLRIDLKHQRFRQSLANIHAHHRN